MALNINVDGINKNVKPEITNNEKYLTSAKSIISSIAIPNDYYYYSQLKNIPDKISNIIIKSKNLNKWIDETTQNIANVERKNANLTNQITNSITDLNLTTETDDLEAQLESFLRKGGFSQLFITGMIQVGAQVGNTIGNAIKDWFTPIVNVGAQIGEKVKSVVSEIIDTLDETLRKISPSIHYALHEMISIVQRMWNDFVSFVSFVTQTVVATVVVYYMTLILSLIKTAEPIVDTVAIGITGIGSAFTGISDGIHHAKTGEWGDTTETMWKNTMSFVAEKWSFDPEYLRQTKIGSWLDKYSLMPLDCIDVASDAQAVINTIALSVVTGGAVAGALGTSVAVGAAATTAVTGFGKYIGDYWASKRDASWEGMERLYQKGEITEEQYNSFIMIRSLDDETWAEIEKEYKNGLVDEESFQMMKQVREMPEEWRTFENGIKGITYGAINGAWEGIQMYVGCKLSGWVLKEGSQIGTSAIRVGADTAFNAADTPFRTTVGSLLKDKSWEQEWLEQGGWESVLTSAGIGLVGSIVGEVVDYEKIKNGIKFLDESKSFDDLDDVETKKIKQTLMDDYVKGSIDLENMTDDKLQNVIENTLKDENDMFDFNDLIRDTDPPEFVEFVKNSMSSISMSKKMASELKGILEMDDCMIGIHLAGIASPDNILKEGLWLTGDVSSGRPSIPRSS